MLLRPLVFLSLASLLVACGSHAPKPVPAPAPTYAPPAIRTLGPLPAYQREVSGTVAGAPAGSEVELALLVIDDRGRPQRLLASARLNGTNQPLAFQLRFSPEAFPAGARVELRGRVIQSGQLILHLPSLPITQPITQAVGALRFEIAP